MHLIIFDCDGVLIETEFLTTQCEMEALRKLGLDISLEEYRDLAVGCRNDQVAKLLKEKFDLQLPIDFWQEQNVEHKTLFEQKLTSVNGISETIKAIDIPKCIASSSTMERLTFTLNLTKLLPHFNNSIFSTEFVKRGKPHPDIYLYAAEKMQAEPSRCLVIEDSLIGVQGGLAAGMTVFAFGGGKHITPLAKNKLLHSGAHHFFDDMRELPSLLKRFPL